MPLHSFLWMKIVSYLALTTDMERSPQKHYASYQTWAYRGGPADDTYRAHNEHYLRMFDQSASDFLTDNSSD